MGLTIEDARIRVALQDPSLSADEVRREADSLVAKLATIEAADNLRAVIEAQAADDNAAQAADAQRRAEAFSDARAIVAKSHPGWDAASVEMEAHKQLAENESAIAALNVREALAE